MYFLKSFASSVAICNRQTSLHLIFKEQHLIIFTIVESTSVGNILDQLVIEK